MSVKDTLAKQNDSIESLTANFERELGDLLDEAKSRVIATLSSRLKLYGGKIAATPANRALLRTTDDLMLRELDSLGVRRLITSLVGEFNGQYVFFRQILEQVLGEESAAALSIIRLSDADHQYLGMMQQDAATDLNNLVTSVVQNVRRRTLASVGGLSVRELASLATDTLKSTPGIAKSQAATAVSSFYRSLADLSFQKIEEDPNWQVRYKYVGPPASDPVIRPFCEHLMEQVSQGKTWTREEIAAMDNESTLSNVMVFGGGWNCRHQWIVASVTKN